MKKIILAGVSALILSCAIGAASAYSYNKEQASACACPDCSCDNCGCTNCSEGSCDKGCCSDDCGGAACCKK